MSRQVCVIVSTNYHLQQHYQTILKNYLEPIISAFSKDARYTEFCLITYGDVPPLSDTLVRTSKFAPSITDALRKITCNSGALEYGTTEGLAACLQLDWAEKAEKHAILVCHKYVDDYQSVQMEQNNTIQEIAKMIAAKSISLSVISVCKEKRIETLFNDAKCDGVPENNEPHPKFLVFLRGIPHLHKPEKTSSSPAPVSESPPPVKKTTPVPPATTTVPGTVRTPATVTPGGLVSVWRGMLTIGNPSAPTPQNLCNMEAYCKASNADKVKELAASWPTSITIGSKLPQFNDQLMKSAFSQSADTICNWLPIFPAGNPEVQNKYKLIVDKMQMKRLCVFIPTDARNSNFLALFPASLFHDLTSTTQKQTQHKPMMSVMVPASLITRQKNSAQATVPGAAGQARTTPISPRIPVMTGQPTAAALGAMRAPNVASPIVTANPTGMPVASTVVQSSLQPQVLQLIQAAKPGIMFNAPMGMVPTATTTVQPGAVPMTMARFPQNPVQHSMVNLLMNQQGLAAGNMAQQLAFQQQRAAMLQQQQQQQQQQRQQPKR